MTVLSANELKLRGVSALGELDSGDPEAVITVHGKEKYVMMTIEQYNFLRECELETALSQSERDLKDGNVIIETVEKHIRRISNAV